ncbi:MAG: glycosyltransferase family 2 protein [Phycisphaerales bacterium JB064]
MRVAAIIPCRAGDNPRVVSLVAALVSLRDHELSIVVGVDGHGAPAGLERFAGEPSVTIVTGERGGPGPARNRALAVGDEELVLFLNDDVEPAPDLIERHRAAHADGAPKLVLGAAPFAITQPDRVLDRMTRETSLLFFYNTMDAHEPMRDWGFRHAWTLNLSLPRAICAPFDSGLAFPMFDDLEWAYRVCTAHAAPLVYRPEAIVTHHHRYEPRQILAREALLGHQALTLHRVNAACATAVFGERFDGSPHSIAEAQALITPEADEAYAQFEHTVQQPALSVNVHDVFASARPWRMAARAAGFLRAVDGAPPPDAASVLPIHAGA